MAPWKRQQHGGWKKQCNGKPNGSNKETEEKTCMVVLPTCEESGGKESWKPHPLHGRNKSLKLGTATKEAPMNVLKSTCQDALVRGCMQGQVEFGSMAREVAAKVRCRLSPSLSISLYSSLPSNLECVTEKFAHVDPLWWKPLKSMHFKDKSFNCQNFPTQSFIPIGSTRWQW